jgi:hypothetical protein
MGKPRVSPYPMSYKVDREVVHLLYMGGMSIDGLCWFCKFPRESK